MINTLIVDDERLARAEMRRLLKKHDNIHIVGEASDAQQALQILAEQQVELVFLDIQMPGLSGLELAEQLSKDLQFIFCTAFGDYAIEAFALDAVDYLVKPINAERLATSLARVKTPTTPQAAAEQAWQGADARIRAFR